MRIAGHGVDLVEVRRIEGILAEHGDRFLERCFTPAERSYVASRPARAAEHLAARFAAKEAVLKALGTGLRSGIAWTDIEIYHNSLGAPALRISGRAAEVARERGITSWFLSISHTRGQGMASVIAAS